MEMASEVHKAIPSIRRLAKVFTRTYPFADAEELAQEGCLGLLEAASRYDVGRGASLCTFGGKRAIGAMRDHIRWLVAGQRHRVATNRSEDRSIACTSLHDFQDARSAESKEMILRFARFLRSAWPSLPAPWQEVIRLRHLEGASVRDAAATLGVSIATVARRERAGLDWLRERFCEYKYGRHIEDRVEPKWHVVR